MPPPHIVPQPSGGVWDSSLYGILLLDGYSQEQNVHHQRSERVYAEPFYRRFAGSIPIALRVGVEQNLAQWIAFRGFWESDLVWGQKWFQLDLTTTTGGDSYTVHLSGWTVAPTQDTFQSILRLDMELEALLLDPVEP